MSVLLTVLHVVVCFSLIAVILLQAGRGQGLTGASFGGGNVQSVFGTRAADFMTKATTAAAICFLLTSIGLDLVEVKKSKSLLALSQRQTSIDVEAIQKALESVKAEESLDADLQQAAEPAVEEGVTEADEALMHDTPSSPE